jgi:hypothetical protein
MSHPSGEEMQEEQQRRKMTQCLLKIAWRFNAQQFFVVYKGI